MSLHITNADAVEKAIQLASDFMCEQDTQDWEWDIGAALPDSIDPEYGGRKIATRWVVSVHYKKQGAQFDGPAAIAVNIADGSASFMESP